MDRDRFGSGQDEADVDDEGPADRDREPLALPRPEPGGRHAQSIGAYGQCRERVTPLGVGRGRSHDARAFLDEGDETPREARARAVPHRALERPAGESGLGIETTARSQHQKRQVHHEPKAPSL